MDGLADYDRADGFTKGAVDLSYQTMTLTQDRARTFMLDRMDVDETNFAASAGNVMGQFQRVHVIPEIDAYRYSTLAALAKAEMKTEGYSPAAASILEKLNADIFKIWETTGESVELVISMSTESARILTESTQLQKKLDVTDFKRGDITTKVNSFNDIPIIKVPSIRMYTEYLFLTGKDAQKVGGFQKTEAAKKINWIITAKTAPIAISKTEKIRIFESDNNPNADAWKLDYRKYHDLWLPDSKKDLVAVNTQ